MFKDYEPKPYPKSIVFNGKRIIVKSEEEHAEKLKEENKELKSAVDKKPNIEPINLESMDSAQLDKYAFEKFGKKLDGRKSAENLLKEIRELEDEHSKLSDQQSA